jgi:hypothetical protein
VKLSEKKKSELYEAISEPITQLRIMLTKGQIDVDSELFDLQHNIWREVHKALNLDGTA